MKISPYVYWIYVLGYCGNQRVKQTLKLTHHAPEWLASQGAGCTERAVLLPKKSTWVIHFESQEAWKMLFCCPMWRTVSATKDCQVTQLSSKFSRCRSTVFTNTAEVRKRAFSRQRPSCSLEFQHSLILYLSVKPVRRQVWIKGGNQRRAPQVFSQAKCYSLAFHNSVLDYETQAKLT